MRDFLKELNARLKRIETDLHLYKTASLSTLAPLHPSAYVYNNAGPILAGATVNTGDLRGSGGVSINAYGIIGYLKGTSAGVGGSIQVSAGDETPDAYSSQVYCPTAAQYGGIIFSKLGVDGDLALLMVTQNFTNVQLHILGWFK